MQALNLPSTMIVALSVTSVNVIYFKVFLNVADAWVACLAAVLYVLDVIPKDVAADVRRCDRCNAEIFRF